MHHLDGMNSTPHSREIEACGHIFSREIFFPTYSSDWERQANLMVSCAKGRISPSDLLFCWGTGHSRVLLSMVISVPEHDSSCISVMPPSPNSRRTAQPSQGTIFHVDFPYWLVSSVLDVEEAFSALSSNVEVIASTILGDESSLVFLTTSHLA